MLSGNLHRFLHGNWRGILAILLGVLIGWADLLLPLWQRLAKRPTIKNRDSGNTSAKPSSYSHG